MKIVVNAVFVAGLAAGLLGVAAHISSAEAAAKRIGNKLPQADSGSKYMRAAPSPPLPPVPKPPARH